MYYLLVSVIQDRNLVCPPSRINLSKKINKSLLHCNYVTDTILFPKAILFSPLFKGI